MFPQLFPLEPPPPLTTRFSDISFPFRQTPDCSDILTFSSCFKLRTSICNGNEIYAAPKKMPTHEIPRGFIFLSARYQVNRASGSSPVLVMKLGVYYKTIIPPYPWSLAYLQQQMCICLVVGEHGARLSRRHRHGHIIAIDKAGCAIDGCKCHFSEHACL